MLRGNNTKKLLVLFLTLAIALSVLPGNSAFAGPGDYHTVSFEPGAQGKWDKSDFTYSIIYNDPTPTFTGDMSDTIGAGWNFAGWFPISTSTVLRDVNYTASWYMIESTGIDNYQKLTYIVHNNLTIVLEAWGVDSSIRFRMAVTKKGVTNESDDIDPNQSGAFTFPFEFADVRILIRVRENSLIDLEEIILNYFTVIFDPGDHGIFVTGSRTVFMGLANNDLTPPSPTIGVYDGWRFTGWAPGLANRVTGSVTYIPQYEPREYTVTYARGDHGTFTEESTGGLFHDADTPAFIGPVTGDPGWTFTGWAPTWRATILFDEIYTAQWTRTIYSVVYEPGTQGTWSAADETYTAEYGDTTPAFGGDTSADHNPGWTFAGWTPALAATVTNSETYIAQWRGKDYIKVIFDANTTDENVTGPAPVGKTVVFNAAYGDLAVIGRTGYIFGGWYTAPSGGVQVTAADIVTNADDHILYAHWSEISTDGPGSGGSVNPSPSPAPTVWTQVTTPRPIIEPTPESAQDVVEEFEDEDQPFGATEIFISDHVSYILGYEDGTVRPEKAITRAEVATVFFRLLNENMRSANWTLENPFSDVAAGSWYNTAVSVIANMGIIRGYEDGSFVPDAPITRAELAAIASRFAVAMRMTGDNEVSFNDIAGHWAGEDIYSAATIGWVSGYPDGSFRPDHPITRAEFITLANNVLERVPEVLEDLLGGQMTTWSDNADEGAWYYIAVQEATNSHEYMLTGQTIPGKQFEYERWTEMMRNPDWIELEKQWIAEYSTQ